MTTVAPSRSSPLPEVESRPTVELLLRFTTAMVVLMAVASFPRSSFFHVNDIIVTGHHEVAAHEIIARGRVRMGDPILAVRAAEVASRVARHPKIASANVTVHPSGRVVIAVTERRPRVVLLHQGRFLIVDHSGVVMDIRTTSPAVPLVRIEGLQLPWIRAGDELPASEIAKALQVLQVLPPSLPRDGMEIRMDSSGEFAVVIDQLPVLLGPIRGLAGRAALLPEVLSAIRSHGLAVQYLDLRFGGSVIMGTIPGVR